MRASRLLALRLLLVPGLLLAPGCDRLSGEDPAATAEADAASAAAPAEPQPEEPIVVADEMPAAGLELLTPGKDPRTPVTVTPTAGAQRQLVMSLRVTKLGKRKRPQFPFVRASIDSTLEVVADGARTRKLALRTIELPEATAEDPAEVSQLAGKHRTAMARLTQVETSELEAATLPAAEVDADMRGLVGTVGHAMSHLAVPLPTDPLGSGATWIVRRDVDLYGIPTRQTLECTLEKKQGNQVEVSAQVTYALSPQAGNVGSSALGLGSVESVSGKAKLHAMFDQAAAVPVEMRLRGKLTIRGKNLEGNKRTRRIGLDLRVDENFLSQGDTRAKFDGQFVQGGLVHGVVAPGTTVWFRKKRVKVSGEGDFLIGFGRNAPPRALLSFGFPDSPVERHVVLVADRTFEPESIDGLPDEMVKLDKETKKALAKSRKPIEKVRNKASNVPYFRDGWQWPAKGRVTSTYGRKRTLNGVDKGYHWGIDLAAPVGREVVAPAPGKVVFAEADVPLSGLLLILDHGHGLTSSFLHLSEFSVEKGDIVEAGQQIGKIGNTGRSTGPHLDWRMNLFDTRVDPQLLVGEPPT